MGIFVVDGRGRFVDGNPAGLELLGVDEASAASKAVQDFLDEAGREEAPRALAALSATGKLEKEVRLRRPDGQVRRIILSVAAIAEDRFLAFCQDITERELAEEQLREVKERFSFVIDGSNDGFWDWDIPSGRAKFSRRWASMFGYDLDELEPTVETWERMAHHEDHAAAGSTIQAHLQGRTDHFETVERVRHKGGHWVWVLARGKVVERDAAGSPVRVTGTFTDISERRRAEEALQTTLAEKDLVLGELRKALQEVKTLSGLLPICMYCKKIRDDKGYWKRIEEYIQSRTDAVFSHGMCEDCYRKHQAD